MFTNFCYERNRYRAIGRDSLGGIAKNMKKLIKYRMLKIKKESYEAQLSNLYAIEKGKEKIRINEEIIYFQLCC